MFYYVLTSYLTDELHSPVSVNTDLEPAFNPELAKKDACELQESYETALWGEGEDEGDNGEGDEGDDSVGDDDDDDGSPAGLAGNDLMDVDGPGLSQFPNNC